jgi:hypothetical protein
MHHSAEVYKREISLIDFARIKYGYRINRKKSSKKQVVLENHDSKVIVSRNHQGQYWYFNPQKAPDKGTIIDFVLNREACKLEDVPEILTQYMENNQGETDFIPIPNTRNNTSFEVSPLEDFYYLEKRGIMVKTIFADEFRGRIFNSIHKNGSQEFINIAFPIYVDQQIVGLELKNAGFHGYAPGSLKSLGIWISNYGHLDKDSPVEFLIAESGIDGLSYHQLFPPDKNRIYISTGGVLTDGQLEEIQRIINVFPQVYITLASDNDLAGSQQNLHVIGKIEVNEKSRRIKARILPLDRKTLILNIDLLRGNADLVFETNSLVQIFAKDRTLALGKENIATSYVKNTNSQIQISINKDLPAMRRLETILPLIRGIKTIVSVKRPVNKDFNEDLQEGMG